MVDFPVLPDILETPGGRIEDNQFITPGITYAGAVPEQMRLPSLAELQGLTNAELMEVLQHYGVMAPWGAMVTRAQQYVTRMTELRPGSPEWQAEVDRLITTDSRRGMLSLNRRVAQTWSSLEAIDGDVNKTMIWLPERDENTCENCSANGGKEKTWAEWQVSGPPGAAVCLGGDQCRCDLVVVE
jgi:hypothetical protein